MSDFAVMLAIAIMTLFDVAFGVATQKLNVPSTFKVGDFVPDPGPRPSSFSTSTGVHLY